MIDPSPNAPKRRATRARGPIAPSSLAWVQDHRTTSLAAVMASLRRRLRSDASRGGRSIMGRDGTPARLPSGGRLLQDVHAAGRAEPDHVGEADAGALDLAVTGL